MAKTFLATLFAAAAFASPIEEKGLNCNAVDAIVNIMHAQKVATPFCSSVLNIPTVTQTKTVTSSPGCQTTTTSVGSTATVTSFATSVIYGTTTVYPVVAVSTTSTCALGATVVPQSSGVTAKVKRGGNGWPATTTAIGVPTCLSNYQGGALTSACSCLSIPTPTSVSIATVTLPVSTVGKAAHNR
jgi:hypothetical protein